MQKLIIGGLLIAGMAASKPAFAQADTNEVTQLKQRVAQLEKQVQEISQLVEPMRSKQVIDNRRKALRDKFDQRMAEDQAKHSKEEMRESEKLYQVANEKWGSQEATQSLEALLKKYPDLNRTGCATLYIAQRSKGEERIKFLNECIEKYSDCFYGDGVQVGAFARFFLAEEYQNTGQQGKATALCNEIKAKYPTSIDHAGNLLVERINDLSK